MDGGVGGNRSGYVYVTVLLLYSALLLRLTSQAPGQCCWAGSKSTDTTGVKKVENKQLTKQFVKKQSWKNNSNIK